jgi:Flp pilus assembly protein TadG
VKFGAWIGGAEAERGSAMVEFAIVSTLALTLIFGIIEFGRALYTYHLVSSAARLGSRYAMVRGSACAAAGCPADTGDVQTYVRSLAPGVNPASLAVTTTWSTAPGCISGANDPGCLVTVSVTYPFSFVVPLLPSLTLPLSSASQMVISQ